MALSREKVGGRMKMREGMNEKRCAMEWNERKQRKKERKKKKTRKKEGKEKNERQAEMNKLEAWRKRKRRGEIK
jgi:hypothetical protein